jgi:hypothetical protein
MVEVIGDPGSACPGRLKKVLQPIQSFRHQEKMPRRTVAEVLAKNRTFRFPLKVGDLAEIEDDMAP